MKRRQRKKRYKPRAILGLTWLQKLAIEECLSAASQYFWEFSEAGSEVFEEEDQKTLRAMHRVLAMFRSKTKHMKPPKRRRRKRVKK